SLSCGEVVTNGTNLLSENSALSGTTGRTRLARAWSRRAEARGSCPAVRQHMRTFSIFFTAAGFICGLTSASAAAAEVQAVRANEDVVITHPERVAAKLMAIAESCSVDSTRYAVAGSTWTQILSSDSFVHVVFANPRRIRLLVDRDTQGLQERMIREVLFPL